MSERYFRLRPAGILLPLVMAFFGAAIVAACLLGSRNALAKSRKFPLEVEKITIGEDTINIKSTQLIEVAIKNRSRKDIYAVVKLQITLPNHNMISFGGKKIRAKAQTVSRVLFPYWIGRKRAGEHSVGAKVFSSKGKLLAKSNRQQAQHFLARDPSKKHQPPRLRGRKKAKKPEKKTKAVKRKAAPVQFDPPDLLWKEAKFINKTSVLRGESANVRLQIHNDGGDIATDVEYSVFWYFVPRSKRKTRFHHDIFRAIAPGEKKIIEVPLTIPDREQMGKYRVLAVVDETNKIKEKDETNNRISTQKDIVFSDIALTSPEEGHSFAEHGLFAFEWRSIKYNQFRVEISAEPSFLSEENMFRIPKGGEGRGDWTSSTSIKPLEGEMMPGLALGLLESNGTDHLYWRVAAKNPNGKSAVSEARRFFITLKPKRSAE